MTLKFWNNKLIMIIILITKVTVDNDDDRGPVTEWLIR